MNISHDMATDTFYFLLKQTHTPTATTYSATISQAFIGSSPPSSFSRDSVADEEADCASTEERLKRKGGATGPKHAAWSCSGSCRGTDKEEAEERKQEEEEEGAAEAEQEEDDEKE